MTTIYQKGRALPYFKKLELICLGFASDLPRVLVYDVACGAKRSVLVGPLGDMYFPMFLYH